LTSQYTSGTLLTNLVKGVARNFNKEAEAAEVEDFFRQHPLDAVTRYLNVKAK
jgi:hypothetical protein